MATRKKRTPRITVPTSPVSGAPPLPGTPGYDPYGFPGFEPGSRWRGHKFFKRLMKNAPPFLADFSMFNQAQRTINDILAQHGRLNPEVLARNQAAILASGQNAQRGVARQAALTGADPGSAEYAAIAAGVGQGTDRQLSDERFQEEQAAQDRERSDLNLVNPYLQTLLAYTAPKGRNQQVTPAPVSGSPHTDWAGIGANLLGSYIQGAAPGQGHPGWDFGF